MRGGEGATTESTSGGASAAPPDTPHRPPVATILSRALRRDSGCTSQGGATEPTTQMGLQCRSKLRARRGPREEATGAYEVVREDRRRPRTKYGEVNWTGTYRARRETATPR